MTSTEFLKENTYSIDCAPGYGEIVERCNAEQYAKMVAIEYLQSIRNGDDDYECLILDIDDTIAVLKKEIECP